MAGYSTAGAWRWTQPVLNTKKSSTPTYQPTGSNAMSAATAAQANAPKPVLSQSKTTPKQTTTNTSASIPVTSAPVEAVAASSGGNGIDYVSVMNQWQNQMRQAAEQAYNQGKVALEDAYSARTKSLLDNHSSIKDQLTDSYNASRSDIEADSAKSLREAYINNMLNKRDINQLLSAQGLSGGASESTLAKMLNNYGNNRNNIHTNTSRNLLELETSHNANLAEALRNYNDALADAQERRMQYLMQLEQNRASGVAGSIPSLASLAAIFS